MTGRRTASDDRGWLAGQDVARLLAGSGKSPGWQWFGGHAFAVVGDLEPLRMLFEVEGCTVTAAHTDTDGRLRLVSRQVTLYRDPQTRQIIERWQNPYTGREIVVGHQHLPAVSAMLPPDSAAQWLGTDASVAVFLDDHEAAHFPLCSVAAPAGLARRATSSAQLFVTHAALDDPAISAVEYTGAWQLLVDWPEWLGMQGAPGYWLQRSFVRKTSHREDLPEALRRAITARFADGLDLPELDHHAR